MRHYPNFYIDGSWVPPVGSASAPVINPATEEAWATISMGGAQDVDRAVKAAKSSFATFSRSSREERLELLRAVLSNYEKRSEDMAQALMQELGSPISWSRDAQVAAGQQHLLSAIRALEAFRFEEIRGTSLILREPIGVCALITPWNWPLNQIVCKVAPALAAGCTMVLKPSEITPVTAIIFTEILDASDVPAGVFNLVNGDGPSVGQALASHPDVDMVSFTGSTRAGITVAKSAADTVKRVAQELGGKSANIILADADIELAVSEGARACFSNAGQSCDAPTRMLVPADRHDEAVAIAATVASRIVVGDPKSPTTEMGPLVNKVQYDRVQALIESAIEEGATLVAGGMGRPEHLTQGFFVRPTVFGNVVPGSTIEREEVFGPVLSIIPYEDEEEAVRIANDSIYGLAAYVQGSPEHARLLARRLRAGQVHLNYPDWDLDAPFGGYKQSGNGREYADWAMHDFCEVKAVIGHGVE